MQNDQKLPKNTLAITIRNPERLVYEGIVKGVSSINEKGPFDVLAEHENFISIIKEKIVVYPVEGKKQEWNIDTGVLKVKQDRVNVFLGIDVV